MTTTLEDLLKILTPENIKKLDQVLTPDSTSPVEKPSTRKSVDPETQKSLMDKLAVYKELKGYSWDDLGKQLDMRGDRLAAYHNAHKNMSEHAYEVILEFFQTISERRKTRPTELTSDERRNLVKAITHCIEDGKITLDQIAKASQVSKSHLETVLNNHRTIGHRVTARIYAAISELQKTVKAPTVVQPKLETTPPANNQTTQQVIAEDFEKVLGTAFKSANHTLTDLDRVRKIIIDNKLKTPGADAVEVAEKLLDAVHVTKSTSWPELLYELARQIIIAEEPRSNEAA